MDREICRRIGLPRELVRTVAYLTGQGWKAGPPGTRRRRETEEGSSAQPVRSNQVCKLLPPPPLLSMPLGFRFRLISPRWRRPLPPQMGARGQEHGPEHSELQTHWGWERGREDSGNVFSSDVKKCQETRGVLAREQRARTGPRAAGSPRAARRP